MTVAGNPIKQGEKITINCKSSQTILSCGQGADIGVLSALAEARISPGKKCDFDIHMTFRGRQAYFKEVSSFV